MRGQQMEDGVLTLGKRFTYEGGEGHLRPDLGWAFRCRILAKGLQHSRNKRGRGAAGRPIRNEQLPQQRHQLRPDIHVPPQIAAWFR